MRRQVLPEFPATVASLTSLSASLTSLAASPASLVFSLTLLDLTNLTSYLEHHGVVMATPLTSQCTAPFLPSAMGTMEHTLKLKALHKILGLAAPARGLRLNFNP